MPLSRQYLPEVSEKDLASEVVHVDLTKACPTSLFPLLRSASLHHGVPPPVSALHCAAVTSHAARLPLRFHPLTCGGSSPVRACVRQPMSEVRELLSACSVSTRLSLSGPLIVARDIAHAKIKERLDRGEGLPQYMRDFAVYYAGPAKTPTGMVSGSFGPTTAGRMDSYVDAFQAAGGSFVMLAKGNRSAQVTAACKKHRGFYLGTIGGPAAIIAQDTIKKVEVLEYPELGMEAVWKIEVKDFPAFVIVDDKGNDFFKKWSAKH